MSQVAQLWTDLDERLIPLLRRYRDNLGELHVDLKPDKTLLSEADLAAQNTIISTICHHFPDSGFIAEEDDEGESIYVGEPTWIIDPIDGTSEFVSRIGREFCSVVCLLREGSPAAAYVLAPELGVGRSPISIHWDGSRVEVNGVVASPVHSPGRPQRVSVTRSQDSRPRKFESHLTGIGCEMKLRTTSQTLDLVRSSIDLTKWTEDPLDRFDLFYRADQKLWDGAAGIGLAHAMGRTATDGAGRSPVPFRAEFLKQREPVLEETLVGDDDCIRWFLELLEGTRAK